MMIKYKNWNNKIINYKNNYEFQDNNYKRMISILNNKMNIK